MDTQQDFLINFIALSLFEVMSTRIHFCLKTKIVVVWPTVHTYSVKTITENASFQKRFPEWRFLKTLASRLRVDGRKQGFRIR